MPLSDVVADIKWPYPDTRSVVRYQAYLCHLHHDTASNMYHRAAFLRRRADSVFFPWAMPIFSTSLDLYQTLLWATRKTAASSGVVRHPDHRQQREALHNAAQTAN
jgi:hypothetical protein